MKHIVNTLYVLLLAVLLTLATVAMGIAINEYIIMPKIYKQIPREVFSQNFYNPGTLENMIVKQYEFGIGARLMLIVGDGIMFLAIGLLLERRGIGLYPIFLVYIAALFLLLNNSTFIKPVDKTAMIIWSLLSIVVDFAGFYCGVQLYRTRRNRSVAET